MGRVVSYLTFGCLLWASLALAAGESHGSEATVPQPIRDESGFAGGAAGPDGPAWRGYLGTMGPTVRSMLARASQARSANAIAGAHGPGRGAGDEGRLAPDDGAGLPVPDPSGIALPGQLWFGPATPNPTSGRVTFRVDLPAAASLRIAILDIQGRIVGEIRERRGAGRHSLAWSGERAWPAGIYLARLEVDGRPAGTRRMVVVR